MFDLYPVGQAITYMLVLLIVVVVLRKPIAWLCGLALVWLSRTRQEMTQAFQEGTHSDLGPQEKEKEKEG